MISVIRICDIRCMKIAIVSRMNFQTIYYSCFEMTLASIYGAIYSCYSNGIRVLVLYTGSKDAQLCEVDVMSGNVVRKVNQSHK